MPLHAVSSGQVFLAYRTPAGLERYLARPLERFTDRTLVEPEAVRERVREIRRDGYAWVREEFDEGINSVAAPVADASGEVVAAVHLHGPSYRFPVAGAGCDDRRPGRRHRGPDLGPAPTRSTSTRHGPRNGSCSGRMALVSPAGLDHAGARTAEQRLRGDRTPEEVTDDWTCGRSDRRRVGEGRQAPREGTVLQVIEASYGTRYRVLWDDGHESTFRPSAGSATIVPAGEADSTRH